MEQPNKERSYGFGEFWLKYIRTYLAYSMGKPIKNRKDLPILLRILNSNGKGAEVGVLWGAFSKILLENSKLSTLYMIDPWMPQSMKNYKDGSNASEDENEIRYQKVVNEFQPYGSRSEILRLNSEEAAEKFQQETLDFVYIDANHSYEAVQQDIQLWWPKVKLRGIISGHDYFDGGRYDFGVKSAVDEFVSKTNQQLFVIEQDWPSWYIIKSGDQ